MTSDPSGHESVHRSVAGPDEVAAIPDDGGITVVEVTDTDDDAVGLLLEWKHPDNSTWMYAEVGSYDNIHTYIHD